MANAVAHATRCVASGQPIGLRLLRRTGEVMCAVLDPSATAPVLRLPDRTAESGRGLQMVDALSDVWGWSPVTGRGKAVWAILFCALRTRAITFSLSTDARAAIRMARISCEIINIHMESTVLIVSCNPSLSRRSDEIRDSSPWNMVKVRFHRQAPPSG